MKSVLASRFMRVALIIFVLLPVYGVYFAQAVWADTAKKNVLILDSDRYGNKFSDDETAGILDTLRGNGLDFTASVEYLDWKRYPSPKRLDILYEDYKQKYAAQKIDLIFAEDDASLEFALAHRAEIFSDAPIVFSGVDDGEAAKIIPERRKLTGVTENSDPEGTIAAALTINPALRQVYVIHDHTEIGQSIGEMTAKAIAQCGKNLTLHDMSSLITEEIYQQVQHLSSDSMVLITSYHGDSTGATVEYSEFCRKVSDNSIVPVYHLYDYAIGYGTIGGSLLTGIKHGQTAGAIGLRVLQGEDIDTIPISHNKTCQLMFDYNQLQRFHIGLDQLPASSQVVNKPFSFYETYRNAVDVVIAVAVILLALTLGLLRSLRCRSAVEHILSKKNTELHGLYEEVTASAEELQKNYDEISAKQLALAKSEERYSLAVEGSYDVIWDYDVQTDTLYLSQRAYDLLGYDEDYPLADRKCLLQLIHPDDRNQLQYEQFLHSSSAFFTIELRIQEKTGDYRWISIRGKSLRNAEGLVTRMAGSVTDITERKHNEQTMHDMAYFDALTGLANRAMLENTFKKIREDEKAAVLFLDIDHFKDINDTMGHDYGDSVLICVANILRSVSNDNILLTRRGGDEFIILYKAFVHKGQVEDYVQKIMTTLETPMKVKNVSVRIGVSIGLAFYPQDGAVFGDVLRNADTALYCAKNLGRRQSVYFEQSMSDQMTRRLQIEGALQSALDNNEFVVYYQPQFSLVNKEICGFEALIRWQHSETEIIYPEEFIKMAEDTGQILGLGRFVLQSACALASSISMMFHEEPCIAVNVSVIQFNQDDFVKTVVGMIRSFNLRPCQIGLEITETLYMERFEENAAKLTALRDFGVPVILDDFGTGYSSLKYLQYLPLNKLKIDKTFIERITISNEQNITENIIQLAHKLGMQVVAEGVETEEQFALLEGFHCDVIQGYYISKPKTEAEIIQWFSRTYNQLVYSIPQLQENQPAEERTP